MFRELDTAVLARDLPEAGLEAGDLGAVVHVHDGGAAYEVEFVTGEGKTLALLTLEDEALRPMASAEILHVRPVHRATG